MTSIPLDKDSVPQELTEADRPRARKKPTRLSDLIKKEVDNALRQTPSQP